MNNRYVIVGVDPGLSGAIFILFPDGKATVQDMPTLEIIGARVRSKRTGEMKNKLSRVYDRTSLSKIVWGIRAAARAQEATPVWYVEKVHAMPDQGVTSMFNMGVGYGTLLTAPAIAGIRVEEVSPQAWKKEVLAGQGHDKDGAIYKAQQLFPALSFRGPKGAKLDGRADAACIAWYGRAMNMVEF